MFSSLVNDNFKKNNYGNGCCGAEDVNNNNNNNNNNNKCNFSLFPFVKVLL